jgi:regulator of protease activity HflC (stomatin/prohibitin superfamily)
MEAIIGLAILAIFIGGPIVFFGSFFTVRQQTVAIVQRFGKHAFVGHPGLNFKLPMIDSVVARLNLRIQEMQVRVETKTLDNVFVNMTIAVQYQISQPQDAFYKLDHPTQQIESYVFDVVRAKVPQLRLDKVFEAKDDVANAVLEQLSDEMDDFGYRIIKALVTDIDPAPQVKDSMNRINAAERLKVAAEMEAEAAKIRVVKSAEAEAESKHLQGIGIAKQRKAIADGLSQSAEAISHGMGGASGESVMALLMLTQYFDTLNSMANKSETQTIFMPHSPGGVADLFQQVSSAIMSANMATQNIQQGSAATPAARAHNVARAAAEQAHVLQHGTMRMTPPGGGGPGQG